MRFTENPMIDNPIIVNIAFMELENFEIKAPIETAIKGIMGIRYL